MLGRRLMLHAPAGPWHVLFCKGGSKKKKKKKEKKKEKQIRDGQETNSTKT